MATEYVNPSMGGNGASKDHMDERFDRLEDKMDSLKNDLDKITNILKSNVCVSTEITNEVPNTTLESNETELPQMPEISSSEPEIQNNIDIPQETQENEGVISIGDLLNSVESQDTNLDSGEVELPNLNIDIPEVTVDGPVETPAIDAEVPAPAETPVMESAPAVEPAPVETPAIDATVPTPVETPVMESAPAVEPAPVETPAIDATVPTPVETPVMESAPAAEPAPVETPVNNNVEILNINIPEAMGDGKQRSVVISEAEHNNLVGNVSNTLTLKAA